MAGWEGAVPGLVLVIDHDTDARRVLRRALESWGFDVVQAGTGIVGLELIQRLPDRFRFVLVDLDLPGLPGRAVVETLVRLRPELPVVCVSAAYAVTGAPVAGCLSKPLEESRLERQVQEILAGGGDPWVSQTAVAPNVVARVRARYETTGDLVEAAIALAQAMPEI